MKAATITGLALLVLLAGCQTGGVPTTTATDTPTPSPSPTATSATTPAAQSTPTSTATPTPTPTATPEPSLTVTDQEYYYENESGTRYLVLEGTVKNEHDMHAYADIEFRLWYVGCDDDTSYDVGGPIEDDLYFEAGETRDVSGRVDTSKLDCEVDPVKIVVARHDH